MGGLIARRRPGPPRMIRAPWVWDEIRSGVRNAEMVVDLSVQVRVAVSICLY